VIPDLEEVDIDTPEAVLTPEDQATLYQGGPDAEL
jgi:hypothetical protein